MSCMFLSGDLSSNGGGAAKGSFLTTFRSGVRCQEGYSPEESRKEPLKSSRWTSTPETSAPEGVVTVNVTGLAGFAPRPRAPAFGKRKRCCSVAGLYLFPIPAKSPDGEWQVLHLPSPLKYASPALGSPVSTFWTSKMGEPRSVS